MKRNLVVLAFVAACGLLAPADASAGGVVIDGRVRSEILQRFAGHDVSFTAASANAGAGPRGSEHQGEESSESDESVNPASQLTAYEYRQVQAGLITEEEAAAGCGGATAATGPAGLLPLLVAAGALLRRRR